MATDTARRTEHALTDWAEALTKAGWTPYEADTPRHLAGLRHLLDPAGRVQARAHAHHAGDIDVELRSTARRDDDGLLWYVIAGWLGAPAVIAAARAADDQTTGRAAGDQLTKAGWHLQRYEALTLTSSEYQWASADSTHWALYTTPDPDGEGDGGWILARPGPDGHRQRITASASTPAALVAALALPA